MAEIGNGYGSEFQLLRFLGHHRNELNQIVKKALRTDSEIEWLDFPYDDKKLSGDGEYIGINFLSSLPNNSDIKTKWDNFWPSRNKAQHWDAIAKVDDTWILVEAKAHSEEMKSDCGAGENGKKIIESQMIGLINEKGIKPNGSWLKEYYQKANRLLFAYFLETNDIQCRVLYIYFVNGFKNKGVVEEKDWEKLIKEQDTYLGIVDNDWVKHKVKNIIVNCKKRNLGI